MVHVVLYQPEKPQNTGNIMRTCVASRCVLHIIGPISFSFDDKNLKRAGMDYIGDLKYFIYKDYDEFLLKNPFSVGYTFYVTRYSNKVYSNFDFHQIDKDYYFMFGKESSGIPHDILLKNKDYLLRIPMVSDARSLNLSNSVAIVIYEALRQQNFSGLSTYEAIKGERFLYEEKNK